MEEKLDQAALGMMAKKAYKDYPNHKPIRNANPNFGGYIPMGLFPRSKFIRFCGYGLRFTPTSRPRTFSERMGLKKYITLFGWRVTWLSKN